MALDRTGFGREMNGWGTVHGSVKVRSEWAKFYLCVKWPFIAKSFGIWSLEVVVR